MSIQKERVSMAKDVLARIKANKIKVSPGDYVNADKYVLKLLNKGSSIDDIFDMDAKQFFRNKKCSVCAKGALLLSAIDRYNKIKLRDIESVGGFGASIDLTIDYYYPAGEWLRKYFTSRQLGMIEAAFELDDNVSEDTAYLPEKTLNRCIAFGEKYKNSTDRLEAIMKNIVKNNGQFKP